MTQTAQNIADVAQVIARKQSQETRRPDNATEIVAVILGRGAIVKSPYGFVASIIGLSAVLMKGLAELLKMLT